MTSIYLKYWLYIHIYEVWSKNNRYFKIIQKVFIYLPITILSPSREVTLDVIHLCQGFFPILETVLKHAFWYRQQFLFQFFFHFLNRSKTLSFHRCLQFWEEEKVSGGQVWWIRWLRHDYGFVFGQTLMHKHRYMWVGALSWCKIHDWFFHNSVSF